MLFSCQKEELIDGLLCKAESSIDQVVKPAIDKQNQKVASLEPVTLELTTPEASSRLLLNLSRMLNSPGKSQL